MHNKMKGIDYEFPYGSRTGSRLLQSMVTRKTCGAECNNIVTGQYTYSKDIKYF